MMVEVPAAVEMAAAFAREVDFFSIGTNDLTQYVFAAERGSPQVAALSDALHPAILGMIGRVADAGWSQGKPTAVCGEMASDPAAIPLLVGLGVAELSMSAAAIPQAKAILRQVSRPDAEALARAALALETAAQVRQLVRERFGMT
jgi:phosphocarrier protein FPr